MKYNRYEQKNLLERELSMYQLELDENKKVQGERESRYKYFGEESKKYPLEETLEGSFDHLVHEAWRVNCLAKEEPDLYNIKNELLLKIIERARFVPNLSYGLGTDDWENEVLYIDLHGRGQVSFHTPYMPSNILDEVPHYPFSWTQVRNNRFDKGEVDLIDRKINVRGFLKGEGCDFTYGEIHNQILKSGGGKEELLNFYEKMNSNNEDYLVVMAG